MKPKVLYHAAPKKFDELKPGIKIAGKLVEWDFGESNKYLYAVDDREAAIEQGLAGAIEKKYLIDRVHTNGKYFSVTFSKDQPYPDEDEIAELDVYLYEIKPAPEQLWMKNNNAHNKLEGEYKTTATIPEKFFTVEKIDLHKWLKNKELSFVKTK